MFNKSNVTNALALLLMLIGFALDNMLLKAIGMFAFSGAVTNWLAIHMLFEKVPGLYGSGVIPQRFDDFKQGIRNLIMQQFFNADNIERFLHAETASVSIELGPVLDKVDLAPTFDSLVAVIKESSFGQMLGMFGGVQALEPLRQPFVAKMQLALKDITQDPAFVELLEQTLSKPALNSTIQDNIQQVVDKRLDELTPSMVKQIIQTMIKQHLGWLVVWGGVFGGLIGSLAAILG